jgi:hypothetical protein
MPTLNGGFLCPCKLGSVSHNLSQIAVTSSNSAVLRILCTCKYIKHLNTYYPVQIDTLLFYNKLYTVCINVTFRRICGTIVAMDKQ